MNDFPDLISAIAATGAVVIALLAYIVSRRADDRAKIAARTHVYLALRSRFMDLHEQLPPAYSDLTWEPGTPEELAIATRYWQHTFDEWYICRKLDPALLDSLWKDFFSGAVVAGLRHPGLRKHFESIRTSRTQHGTLWAAFTSDIKALAASSHTQSR